MKESEYWTYICQRAKNNFQLQMYANVLHILGR